MNSLSVLTIGNSFSNDATFYLENIAASSRSLALTVDQAALGGCSLERHWNLACQTRDDPDFRPYGAGRNRVISTGCSAAQIRSQSVRPRRSR